MIGPFDQDSDEFSISLLSDVMEGPMLAGQQIQIIFVMLSQELRGREQDVEKASHLRKKRVIMKKRILYQLPIQWAFPCIALVCLFLFTPFVEAEQPVTPSETSQESGGEVVNAKPEKHLSTIIVDNYYPYTFLNEHGLPDGFSVDLIRAVTKVMGLEIDIHTGSWDQALGALATGKIDLLPMMAYSDERTGIFDFSEPHSISYDAFFVVKGQSHLRSMKDLTGKTVIVMNHDRAHDYLISRGITPPDKLVLANSLPDDLRLLASGRGDAALMPKLVGLLYLKELGLGNLELSPFVVDDYQRRFSFAVKKGDKELLDRLSEGVIIIKATGALDQIHRKWFGLVESQPMTLQSAMKYILAVIAALLLVALVFAAWTLSLRKQVALRTSILGQEIAERKRAEERLRDSEQRFSLAMEAAKDGIWDWNLQTDEVYYSPGYLAMLGYSPGEVPADSSAWEDRIHPEDKNGVLQANMDCIENRRDDFEVEFRMQARNGEWRWILGRGKTVGRDENGRAIRMVGTYTDITGRARQTREIKLLNRLYSVLSRVSQAVVRATSPETFLEQACREVVECGGFLQAWIGHVDLTTNAVLPTAFWGEIDEYVQGITVYADNRPEGRGPTGTCIREGHPCVHNDFLHDPQTLPWRDRAAPFGIASSAAFPIERAGRVWGALTIYSDEVDRFGHKDLNLLEKVAVDVGFALDNLDREFLRKQAEVALLENKELLSMFMRHSPYYVYMKEVTPTESRVLQASDNFQQMIGIRGSEMIGKTMHELFPADFAAKITAEDWSVVSSGTVLNLEENLNGRYYTTVKFPIVQEGRTLLAGYTIDITESKQAEEMQKKLRGALTACREDGGSGHPGWWSCPRPKQCFGHCRGLF